MAEKPPRTGGRNPPPGRPKGVPNKITIHVRTMAAALVEDPAYRKALRERLLNGTAGHMETTLWHYAYGKPKETVALDTGSVDSVAGLMLAWARARSAGAGDE